MRLIDWLIVLSISIAVLSHCPLLLPPCQNSHQHLAIALLLQLPCHHVIVVTVVIAVAMPLHHQSLPHHCSCLTVATPSQLPHRRHCTIAVIIAAPSQSPYCCSHTFVASLSQLLHHRSRCRRCLTIAVVTPSLLLHHCHVIAFAAPVLPHCRHCHTIAITKLL